MKEKGRTLYKFKMQCCKATALIQDAGPQSIAKLLRDLLLTCLFHNQQLYNNFFYQEKPNRGHHLLQNLLT